MRTGLKRCRLIDVDALDAQFPYVKAAGINTVYIPAMPAGSDSDAADSAKIEKYIATAKANGPTVGYHNHSREYRADGYDMLKNLTRKFADLRLQLDLFWVTMAGLKPADKIK